MPSPARRLHYGDVCCVQVCMEHLLGVMRNPAERTTGFAALGEMAGAVGDALTPYLPAITPLLREAVSPFRRPRCGYSDGVPGYPAYVLPLSKC